MTDETIKTAIAEAKRFLDRAKELQKSGPYCSWRNPKESGAIRRASMDLTRALAELRK